MEIMEVNDSVRKLLDKLPAEEKREMVAKSRWTCDSNWMMAMVFTSGWEAANKMNLQVAKSVGKAEMHRLMKLLGIERPRREEEVMKLMSIAMQTFVTRDYFDYEFKVLEPGKTLAIVRQCYAYTKTSSIGVEKDYQCGCSGMRAGWYEAMGVEVKESLKKCLKDGSDHCEIIGEYVA
jgi:hypothetical protein